MPKCPMAGDASVGCGLAWEPRTRVGLHELGGTRIPQGKGSNFGGISRPIVKYTYGISSVSQSYSLDGSSDAACRRQ